MKRTTLALVVTLAAALSAVANPALFGRYETVRQALLNTSLKDVQTSAAALAADARKAKQEAIAKQADAVAKSGDLNKARESFGALSTAMIELRAKSSGNRPSVYTCPMVKKDWLQAKGTVGNPYDARMPECGMVKAE